MGLVERLLRQLAYAATKSGRPRAGCAPERQTPEQLFGERRVECLVIDIAGRGDHHARGPVVALAPGHDLARG